MRFEIVLKKKKMSKKSSSRGRAWSPLFSFCYVCCFPLVSDIKKGRENEKRTTAFMRNLDQPSSLCSQLILFRVIIKLDYIYLYV